MGRSVVKLVLVVAAIAGSLYGAWFYTRPTPTEVVVKPVERGDVERAVANTRAGTVKACRRAKLSPGIGGQIALMNVREGDRVKAGHLLLELWNADLAAELELAISETKVTSLRAEAACLNAEVAKREADRLVRLRKRGVASEDETDKAVTEAQARKAECSAVIATATVRGAQVEVIKAQLDRTRLVAPFNGVVAEVNGELNEYVTPSPPGIPTPPAVDLLDTSCFYVSAPIDEVDVADIRVGMPARISLDAFPDRYFDARVSRISPYVLDLEKQARTVDVEAKFEKADTTTRLLAGYSADIEVILDVHPNTLRIPTESLVEEDRVFVYSPETQTLEQRTVQTGISNWDYTEVLSGVAEGDLVVTSVDRRGVENGARVRPE